MKVNQVRGQIAIARLGMNGTALSEELLAIEEQVLGDKRRLIAAFAGRDISKDARLTALNNFSVYLGRARLQIHLLGELLDDEWFDKNSPGTPDKVKIDTVVSFEKSVKYSFGMDFFTSVETSFRI